MVPIAEAGFHAVAVDQRGYSGGARPHSVSDYGIEHLLSDIHGFANALGRRRFHLVGHNWGAFLAWAFAAEHSDRVQSLSALSTPHPNAFLNAMETEEDQKRRSQYISFFKMPNETAENFFRADNYQRLRTVYQGKLTESAVSRNIQRLAEPGALTAVLNWYRALDLTVRVGKVTVPTLYIWSTQDHALGEAAAMATSKYVTGPYCFERLEGSTHWLLEEVPDQVSALVLKHVCSNREH